MAEPDEKGPLEKPIDWLFGWKASFERTRPRFGMPVAVLLALSVAGGLVWWNWDDIAKRPGVESILARFKQRALPIAPAGRLAIAVAHLERDKDQEHETLLLDELRQFEGAEAVSVDRTVDPEQPDKKIAEEEARGLLRQTGADVLVWGSVISWSGKSAMRCYWTPSRDISGAKTTGKYQTETIALPVEFWSERESGTARLDEAVSAYREALQERTRARVPLEWAKSTGNKGVALTLLAGRRQDGKTGGSADRGGFHDIARRR